jgi:hypothetical protein
MLFQAPESISKARFSGILWFRRNGLLDFEAVDYFRSPFEGFLL